MAKFVYVYTGGAMAETPEAQQESMKAWTAWFAGLDGAVVDIGNPFGEASTVTSAGSTPGAVSGLGGYSIVEADSLAAAAAKAAGCPVLGSGGSVEIYDALPM